MASPINDNQTSVRFTSKDPDSTHVKIDTDFPCTDKMTMSATNKKCSRRYHKSQHRTFPIMFERASGSWWNPKFDSIALEKQFSVSGFPLTQRLFRYALFYVIISSILWSIFFSASMTANWITFVVGSISVLLISAIILVFTYTKFYQRYYLLVSILFSLFLCGLCLAKYSVNRTEVDISSIGAFCICIELIIMIYTVIPMPLFVCFLIGVIFSITYEILAHTVHMESTEWFIILGKVFLHICIHLIGIHMFVISHVRFRSTFWKMALSILTRRELQNEKKLKENMLDSLMPEVVWRVLLPGNQDSTEFSGEFRKFSMNQMSHVSILYADIVGFTKMSSHKTAEKLVSLLNDLFGRFDSLCAKSGCEKIGTLGDCYYCVSGCPTAKEDHAKCCIEMGLGMIECIKQFDQDNNEEVDMRVGIHTGTVLYGIVGTHRFKFDVWSNDVTLANDMESSGKPGRVHISETTYAFVANEYEVEIGEEIEDLSRKRVLEENYDPTTSLYRVQHVEEVKKLKTYFIVQKKTIDDVLGGSGDSDTEEGFLVKEEADGKIDDEANNRKPSLRTQILTNHAENQRPGSNGITPTLLTNRRSSGFFAMSEVSMEEVSDNIENNIEQGNSSLQDSLSNQTREQNDLLSTSNRLRGVREENDRQLISVIQNYSKDHEYFYQPPINQYTLNFTNNELEKQYRGHYVETEDTTVRTFASPRYNSFFDVMVSFLFLISVSVCCFVVFGVSTQWIVFFSFALVLKLFIVIPSVRNLFLDQVSGAETRFRKLISRWSLRQLIGAVVTCLPVIAVLANFSCSTLLHRVAGEGMFYCYIFIMSLLSFCNFPMLSSWMKSSLAFLFGIFLLLLLGFPICPYSSTFEATLNFTLFNMTSNTTKVETTPFSVQLTPMVNTNRPLFTGYNHVVDEVILDIVLLLILIWFLNREFEINYRLEFHGDIEAAKDKVNMKHEQDQAEWLLHNIVPQQVSETLKRTNKYSENHKDIGVIFAAIVNFNELFEGDFEGGIEFLRFLNECFCDIELLFKKEKYKDVEKIKTIGSCFMAASGLNQQSRENNTHPNAHLFALMEFVIEILDVMKEFNKSMISFDFVLKIGYNFGDVTSGVIGTTKLFYDIWGDTVNVSSRMYSTGLPNRIQCTKKTKDALDDYFDFEYRGEVAVKGKPEPLRTYLVVKKKDGDISPE